MKISTSDIVTSVLAISALTLGVQAVLKGRESQRVLSIAVAPIPVTQWAAIAATGQWIGSARAPVKIVEFADFTCNHCAEQHEIFKEFQAEFPDQAVVVYKHFPLAASGYALALAAECAADRGHFTAFQDAAFELRAKRNVPRAQWWEVTKAAGIPDSAEIAACLLKRTKATEVETDISDGKRLGITGTPAVLVNGVLRRGVVSLDALRAAVIQQRDVQFPIPKSFRP